MYEKMFLLFSLTFKISGAAAQLDKKTTSYLGVRCILLVRWHSVTTMVAVSANCPRLREEFAIANLPSIRIVLVPPGLFPRASRGLGEHELLLGLLRLLLSYSEMVVVEDAQRLDDVGDCDPAVADEKQVFSVLDVCRRGEVVRAEIDPRGRLVEIDDDEFVVHADAATAGWLLGERFRDVLRQRRGKDGRNIAVRLLQVEAADFPVGDAIDEDLVIFRHLLDRVQNRSRGLVEECERKEQG